MDDFDYTIHKDKLIDVGNRLLVVFSEKSIEFSHDCCIFARILLAFSYKFSMIGYFYSRVK